MVVIRVHTTSPFAVGDIILVLYLLECASVFVQFFILLVFGDGDGRR